MANVLLMKTPVTKTVDVVSMNEPEEARKSDRVTHSYCLYYPSSSPSPHIPSHPHLVS